MGFSGRLSEGELRCLAAPGGVWVIRRIKVAYLFRLDRLIVRYLFLQGLLIEVIDVVFNSLWFVMFLID